MFPARRVRVPGNPFLPSPIVPCGATGCSVSDRSPRRNQSARPRADPKVHPDGPFRGPRHPLGQRSVRTARHPFGPRTLRPFRAAGPPVRLPSSATGENVERSRDSGKPDRSYVFAGLKEVSRAVFAGLPHVSRAVFAGLSHVSRAILGGRSPMPRAARPAPRNPAPVPPGRRRFTPLRSLDIVHAKNPEGALPELRPLGVLHRSGFRYSGPARFRHSRSAFAGDRAHQSSVLPVDLRLRSSLRGSHPVGGSCHLAMTRGWNTRDRNPG